MGLTKNSTGNKLLGDDFNCLVSEADFVVGLIGNPNVGKSSVFNNLTGLHQHTGNWPGKTIESSYGVTWYIFSEIVFTRGGGNY